MSNQNNFHKNGKIIITGAAGLVGQNLVLELVKQGYTNIIAIDKHKKNLEILKQINPDVKTYCADLSEALPNKIRGLFYYVQCVVILHAQITGKNSDDFLRNNIAATQNVVDVAYMGAARYIVHVSSSVVNSKADDDYTRTKKAQEQIVRSSRIPHCILRPTLMFGWFDPKHLGWLSRFMEKVPVFPIPGDGKYMRQPLYERDFCRCIIKCIEEKRASSLDDDAVYDIVGSTRIDYVDIIKSIKKAKNLRTLIIHIPVWLFSYLLKIYAIFSNKPPFTADQLSALTAGDDFQGVDTEKVFGVKQTPFDVAITETFTDEKYSKVVLER